MKNNRKSKALTIFLLLIAIVGLSLGFAAFTQNLNIQSGAIVKSGDNRTFSDYIGYTGTPTCTGLDTTDYNAGTLTGETENYKTTWSGITATLKEPGDKLTCTANITNASQYTAYLQSITTASNSLITCSGDATNKDDVCGKIGVDISVGAASITLDNTSVGSLTGTNAINATDGTATVTFSIEYEDTNVIADDDITGNILIEYENMSNYDFIINEDSSTLIVNGIDSDNGTSISNFIKMYFNGINNSNKIIKRIDVEIEYTSKTGSTQSVTYNLETNNQVYSEIFTFSQTKNNAVSLTITFDNLNISVNEDFTLRNNASTLTNQQIYIYKEEIHLYFEN